ncbi:hypothetical protein Lalb_Chr22g0357691 [Lupinus albus]|uniref:Uncharacterized protein n=1 Tax=Lupinus albus TaxID=3870 RepID=A0A6A4NMP4_LUPAL|nr:hypothetical protein Lalb_Chr22g0357691 [Lupinus albus]
MYTFKILIMLLLFIMVVGCLVPFYFYRTHEYEKAFLMVMQICGMLICLPD